MSGTRAATTAGWKRTDEAMLTRGGGVVFHYGGPAHKHRWAVNTRTGIKTRNCRDCSTVEIQLRDHWMKLGS